MNVNLYDPFPLDTAHASAEKNDRTTLEMIEPFLAKSAGLMRALKSGSVSGRDRVLIKTAIENIQAHRVNCDPFGETEEHNAYILRLMAAKYEDTSAGETFAKRVRPGLRVGQKVRGAHNGKLGTITAIIGQLVKVTFDDGSGESFSLMGSTMETLIPVEAAV